MRNKFKTTKYIWHNYICHISTLIALLLIYFEIFHKTSINLFWDNLLGNLGNDRDIGSAIGNIIVGVLIGYKKQKTD